MLCTHLAESPLRSKLEEAVAPLRDFLEGKRPLTQAEKEHCLDILRYLPAGVAEEFDRAVNELRSIIGKHRHIESIIRLQMRYARLMDNSENLDINRLVKDALKILADDIGKRHITVEMRLGEVPPVKAEEAKLLQVLVNLGLLPGLPSNVLDHAAPQDAAIWEVSRFFVEDTLSARDRMHVRGHLERGLSRLAQEWKINAFLCITSVTAALLMRRARLSITSAGPRFEAGGEICQAYHLTVDAKDQRSDANAA